MSFNHNQRERNVRLLHLGQEIVVRLLPTASSLALFILLMLRAQLPLLSLQLFEFENVVYRVADIDV
jgi:hypothetical protein